MIIKRQALQRSSSSFLLSLIIIRHYYYHYQQQQHHRLRGCYRLMATASSLFQSKHLRRRQYHHPSPNLTLIHRCFPYTRCVKPLSLNNCADTKNQNQIQNSQALAPNLSLPLPQLVHNQARSSINGSIISEFHHGTPLVSTDQPSPEKIMVAVDIDEVLGNFVSALNRFIADRYSSNHSVSEYHVYEFFKIWNCSREEADIRVHEFFQTPYFKTGIHPIPGARQALQKLARFCKLAVVTSRQNAIREHTIEWLDRHYPGLFEEIHFGNHFALEGLSRRKSDICRSLGAKVLIDDNPRYAIECAEVGIRVLLFDYQNSYPWCKIDSVSQHPLVTKVHNWEEVEHQLVSWIVS